MLSLARPCRQPARHEDALDWNHYPLYSGPSLIPLKRIGWTQRGACGIDWGMNADRRGMLSRYEDAFSDLNVGRSRGHEKPHKPIMLLAVMDLIESGRIRENQIEFEPELL